MKYFCYWGKPGGRFIPFEEKLSKKDILEKFKKCGVDFVAVFEDNVIYDTFLQKITNTPYRNRFKKYRDVKLFDVLLGV